MESVEKVDQQWFQIEKANNTFIEPLDSEIMVVGHLTMRHLAILNTDFDQKFQNPNSFLSHEIHNVSSHSLHQWDLEMISE
ncbi:hypothetical protein LguiA_009296 [Lonicera macranthoides]